MVDHQRGVDVLAVAAEEAARDVELGAFALEDNLIVLRTSPVPAVRWKTR